MVNYLDKLYFNIVDKNKLLSTMKYYSFQRLLLRLVFNLIIPIYYRINQKGLDLKLADSPKKQERIIVTMTSFPGRINRLWIVIESLLRQSHKPYMIILWLSKDQFESKSKLPKRLLKQENRGLDIRLCNGDLKSHKKYFYAVQEYPEDFLITVDDDFIYPTLMISKLLELHIQYPGSICCHRALSIRIENDKILPYLTWPMIFEDIGPSNNIFFTSGGGTLFPPKSLYEEVINETVFKNICIFADDIWLNIMSRLNNTIAVKSNFNCGLPLINIHRENLTKINISNGKNDVQLEIVRNYFIEKLGIDAFAKLFC